MVTPKWERTIVSNRLYLFGLSKIDYGQIEDLSHFVASCVRKADVRIGDLHLWHLMARCVGNADV